MSIRRGQPSDAAALGDICYRAFKAIADEHNFPPDVPSPEIAAGLLGAFIAHDGIYDVVAEVDGRVTGSNFLDERNPISGVG
ncbi:MAG TPA: GNAT family N-acetyltransferase, partial [Gammaproteobacteria bacterium]|nr:GNAT family N-acetyltransferase [Gammaproteobacteria bacterium]